MPVKLIVTDLDGTFYDARLQFDRHRFAELREKMKENGILFAVASGNPLEQLVSFFEQPDDFAFVSNNGSRIIDQAQEIQSASIKKDLLQQALNAVHQLDEVEVLILTGKNGCWTSNAIDEKTFRFYQQYFPTLQKVPDLLQVEDQIFSIALAVPATQVPAAMELLQAKMQGALHVQHSGYGDIDLLVPGINKASALQVLMQRHQILPEEVMAFGDADNDRLMLELAGFGFVMKNGSEALKKSIGRVTDLTNEENGVLSVMEEYFRSPDAFEKKYAE